MLRLYTVLCLAVVVLSAPGLAHAYSEVSVVGTYNTLFKTDYSNLNDLMSIAKTPESTWKLEDMAFLRVMSMDTASSADISIGIVGDANRQLVYDTLPWNNYSGSRGYELTALLDLSTKYGIDNNDSFELYVGNTLISGNNARLFMAPGSTTEFLLGFNDNGGWNLGDGDLNEPLIYGAVSATPIPGAFLLLGTGLLGLAGLRRQLA